MKKGLIIAGAIVALVIISGLFENARRANAPAPPKQSAKAERTEEQQRMDCSALNAYAVGKGIVRQALRDPKAATFPLFASEKVQQEGEWYLVDADFIRGDRRIPYLLSLRCSGGEWEVGSLKVNGVLANAGANL